MKKLISIITPTYNCSKYIYRLLDSVLQQTYESIEMLVVDDGSTDDTKDIVEDYIRKFKERGYSLKYIYQKNQGQSAAINNGLSYVHGEYLVWPDADDFYKTDDAIEVLARELDNSDNNVAVVRCLPEYLNENSMIRESAIDANQFFDEYLFEDCLYNKENFWFCSGGYMVKFNLLKEMIPTLCIYTEKNAGQNWQLLLPLFYKYRCVTIPNVMYSVLSRGSSHSRGQYITIKQINDKYRSYKNTIIETLKQIPDMHENKKKFYIQTINKKYKKIILKNSLRPYIELIKPVVKPFFSLLKR